MLTDTSIKQSIEKYYSDDLPAEMIKLSTSLLGRSEFTPDDKARMIIQVLYLDGSLKNEHITTAGCDAINYVLEAKPDIAH